MYAIKSSQKLDQARLAYCSVTNSLLLSCWENSLAGMAEAQKKSLLQDALHQTIIYSIDKILKTQTETFLEEHKSAFQESLKNLIHARAHYLYDPAYHPANNSKTQGGFVLYDTHNSDRAATWQRIGNADEFKRFIISLFKEVFKDLLPDYSPLCEIIIEQFSHQSSMLQLLKKYHGENRTALSKQASVSDLNYTPWATLIGNSPETVLKVYHESDSSLEVIDIKPQHASDLLEIIHTKINLLPTVDRVKYLNSGAHYVPIRIQGVHTFSLLTSHISMKPFFSTDQTLAIATQEKTINQGKEACKLVLSPALREKILQTTYTQLNDRKWIALLKTKLTNIEENLSVTDFRHKLLAELRSLLPSTVSIDKLQREVDLKIASELPCPIKKFWEGSIIHLADSNWQSGGSDIHYGVGINPGSGELELMIVTDTGKAYSFLDQNKYFADHVWELYLHVDQLYPIASV